MRATKSILRYFPTTTIKIREHVLIHKVKNPEYLIDGHIADRKGIRGEKGIKNAFLSAIQQGCEAIVIDLDMNIRTLNIKRLTSHLYWRNSDFASNIIKRCYVIYINQAIVITKDDMDKNKITEKLEKLQPYVILWLYKTVQLEVIALCKHSHPIAKLINFHSIIL